MPRVGAEEEMRTLVECQYSHPAETLSDLHTVRSLFSDLRLYVDFYCFPNKVKKKLVYLAGTVPVHYEGTEYNIPVCIWLHETHPVFRPRCYVCPSISMVINPSCPCVDASGNISLDGLKNWMHGVSDLSLLVSEMKQAFQVDMPLYARCPVQAPPPAGVQVSQSAAGGRSESLHHPSIASSSQSCRLSLTSSYLSGQKASQWEQSREVRVRRSYTEELLGIDFSAPPPSSLSCSNHNNPFLNISPPGPPPEPLSKMMGALRLGGESSRGQQGDSPLRTVQSEAARDRHRRGSGPAPGLHQRLPSQPAAEVDHTMMVARLPPDQAAIFLSLMKMEGRSFSPSDVLEAVQLNGDLPSALRFLTHSCPICQDQVTFSKIITMTHCSCFLCQTCFKTFFSAAIKERSIDRLVCPQCGRPEVRGQRIEESMDYFNLLDTQIRHFLSPQVHELFQRKLRDRALQEMPNFCWCAHACRFSADCGTKGLHAHHPRDCLYHLRDWSVTRLHLLLQHYRVSPSWLEPADGSSPWPSLTGVCLVLELRDDSSRREEPCRQPALPEYRGYCQLHYKERLVELINRCHADPAVLFSAAEMMAELQRWNVAMPTRKPDESEPLYTHRLRQTLTTQLPLRKQRRSLLKLSDDLCPPPSAVAAGPPPPHLLLTD
ncbi:uncharacterized protein si:dkey-181m9.8 isoform X2 [Toxotes jaculatrix]|uniref:uncharacterized protein si:dkey-181m9.8 isoform X2 n=1 Tax=Toxotes jaculatrix TaxID=941984 RepID=UPI001B3AE613|nr:uncharacterized protein si:dkey-181m9.8 isoform X2 [Toxotes jaculatrix]